MNKNRDAYLCHAKRPVDKTYSVRSLIKELSKYPPETPVMGEWDFSYQPLSGVKTVKAGESYDEMLIILDVDGWDLDWE